MEETEELGNLRSSNLHLSLLITSNKTSSGGDGVMGGGGLTKARESLLISAGGASLPFYSSDNLIHDVIRLSDMSFSLLCCGLKLQHEGRQHLKHIISSEKKQTNITSQRRKN